MKVSNEAMRHMYTIMQRIRKFEETAEICHGKGMVQGFIHTYIGEEAIATGVCENLNKDDYIVSTHRGHGHLIAKGGETKYMMAELFGRATGYCRGKGGSMHIADPSIGILGSNGIVGAGFCPACGAGLSAKLDKKGQVCVCFFGDASTNIGMFHEAMNMAAVWKLPVIFVCENNYFGIGTSQKISTAIDDLSDRAAGYGMPGVTIDGNDVMTVYETANEAIKRARKGQGPTMIECKTWRQRGHFTGDNGFYKDPKDQEAWLKKDPIPKYQKFLLDNNVMTKEEMDKVDAELDKELEEAVKFGDESPYPAIEEMGRDVYTDIVEEVTRS